MRQIDRKSVYADGTLVHAAAIMRTIRDYYLERGDATGSERAARLARETDEIGRRISQYPGAVRQTGL